MIPMLMLGNIKLSKLKITQPLLSTGLSTSWASEKCPYIFTVLIDNHLH